MAEQAFGEQSIATDSDENKQCVRWGFSWQERLASNFRRVRLDKSLPVHPEDVARPRYT
jgi:hypothetical protein